MSIWNPRWIESLYSRSAAERAATALELFSFGRDRALDAIRAWLGHPELRKLLCTEQGGQLRITVGLAVHPETYAKIHRAAGSPRPARVPPDQDAAEFELHFPGHVSLDILTTRQGRE